MTRTIKVVDDFNPMPWGRYPKDGPWCGENFRDKYLAPPLMRGEKVIVDLTGYNRYGPSFIDEAFGGLPRKYPLTLETLRELLVVRHDNSDYFSDLAWSRIERSAALKK
tara:strand:- start:1418 stop:1744 length:327 start_codon:yes stop_codon:yes gene_type:complete